MERSRMQRAAFVPHDGAMSIGVERAEGAYLTMADGVVRLDAAGGAIASNIGYGRPEVAAAVARALEETSYVVPVFATEDRLRLAERLVDDWLPAGLSRIYLGSGGSDAVDAALRLARKHFVARGKPERWKIIGRELSYHGATLATLGVGGHDKRRGDFLPYFQDVPKAPACYCYRCPLGLELTSCQTACVSEIERLILQEGPETVAAVIAEPIVGSTAGALTPPDSYWPLLRDICDRHGVLLIADEVMTGFGRTGERFGVDHWQVVPDIMVSGKGLGGSYLPITGVFAKEAVVGPLAKLGEDLMFYTYGGHPAACAAANAVLDIIEREGLVARSAAAGDYLAMGLSKLREHPEVGDVRGRGLLQAIELVEDSETKKPFPAEARMVQRVAAACFQAGVIVYPGGCDPARDVVCVGPPFIVSDEEIDRIVETLAGAVESAVNRYRKSG